MNGRGRPPIFARPMSGAERVKRYRERRRHPLPAPPAPPLAEARLRGLEYELLLRRELFHDRDPIEAELRQIAAVLRDRLGVFAKRYGSEIAAELELPADRLAQLLQRVFDLFLAELDDMHGQIVGALDKAAAHWPRFPPERGKHGPDIPPWQTPRTLAEAQEGERWAKSELETLKLRIRGGELVADAEIRHVATDLVIKWREAFLERPALLATPMVLSEFGLGVTGDMQWRVFSAVNRCAREMLTEIGRGRSDVSMPLE